MRAQEVNLIGGFYADDTRHWSVQDTVNWLPVMAEVAGTRTAAKLATPPGLRAYQQIGAGPIRGMYDCEGRRFIVSGRTLYQVTAKGIGLPLGTIPGVGRVSISHNQFKGGNQLLVCNGQPGGGYVYDTGARTFSRISDEGFPGAISVDYMDSYLLGVEPAGRFWFHSNLADAKDYNTLDRYEAEAAPDKIVGLAVSQFEVVVFGERTTEFFGNMGAATGTFQSKRAAIDRGCASRHTVCKLDNSVFWLGDDGIVYRLDGYSARRVSNVPIERAIANNKWADAFAFTWEDAGHKVYYLCFPDGRTWGYDVVSGLWHRRQSYGLKRWRLNDAVKWGKQWFGGDFQNGKLWLLDWDYPAEGDQPLVRERTSPVLSDNQSAFSVPNIELLFGVGQEPVDIGEAFGPQPGPLVLTGDAPDGVVGDEWGPYAYSASGGTPPYAFSVFTGTLPAGLGPIGVDGILPVGEPQDVGLSLFTIRVKDANGAVADLDDQISIGGRAGNNWDETVVPEHYELSNGNRTVTQMTSGIGSLNQRAVSPRTSGKWYFEVQGFGQFTNTPTGTYGIGAQGTSPDDGVVGAPGNGVGMQSNGYVRQNGNIGTQFPAPLPGNQRCMVAYDIDSGKVWFGAGGSWYGGGNPGLGTLPAATLSVSPAYPMVTLSQPAAGYTLHSAEGETMYPVPAGFERWTQ